jgi:uncharacterized protein (TIGR02453 family)
MIREGIVNDPAAWKKAVNRKGFTNHYALGGESLKRPPRGFDPDHPLVEDLKRKDFIGSIELTQKAVTSPGFLEEYAKLCKAGSPLVEFICRAVGVGY